MPGDRQAASHVNKDKPLPPLPVSAVIPAAQPPLQVQPQPTNNETEFNSARFELRARQHDAFVTYNNQTLVLADAVSHFSDLLVAWASTNFDFIHLGEVSLLADAISKTAATALPPERLHKVATEIDPTPLVMDPNKVHAYVLTRMLDAAEKFSPVTRSRLPRADLELIPIVILLKNYAAWMTDSDATSSQLNHRSALREYFRDPACRKKWNGDFRYFTVAPNGSLSQAVAAAREAIATRDKAMAPTAPAPETVASATVSSMAVAGQSVPQKTALQTAHSELIFRQHLGTFACDGQTFTVAEAKAALSTELWKWTQNGNRYDDVARIANLSQAIVDGAGAILTPPTFESATQELWRQLPDSGTSDQLYASLVLALGKTAAFVPEISGKPNTKDTGLMAAAFFVADYAHRLAREEFQAQAHETGVRRYNETLEGRGSPNVGASLVRSEISSEEEKIEIVTEPHVDPLPPSLDQLPLPPINESKVLDSRLFYPDYLDSRQTETVDETLIRTLQTCKQLMRTISLNSMLTAVKTEIANLPISSGFTTYRAQRHALMRTALDRLEKLPNLDKQVAGQLVRELRRMVAPTMLSGPGTLLQRTNVPKAWQSHVTKATFDTRKIMSDGARAEFCTRALSLPLPEPAKIHILKTMKHWLNDCTKDDWQRSPNEYTAVLTALAMLRKDPDMPPGQKVGSYAKKILDAHTGKLQSKLNDKNLSAKSSMDLTDRLATVKRAMRMVLE